MSKLDVKYIQRLFFVVVFFFFFFFHEILYTICKISSNVKEYKLLVSFRSKVSQLGYYKYLPFTRWYVIRVLLFFACFSS